MSFRPPDPGRSNATDTIPTRIIQSHARDLCEEGAELYKGVWVRPELNESDAEELGFNDTEFFEYHTRRMYEYEASEASTGLGRQRSCAPKGNWSAWKMRLRSTNLANPYASPSTGIPMAGSASMGVPMGGNLTSMRSSASKPKYTATDLRLYMRFMVEQSEEPKYFFEDLQIDAVPAERRFIRHVYLGVIEGDLETLVAQFEALRRNPSSEDQTRKTGPVPTPQAQRASGSEAIPTTTTNIDGHAMPSNNAPRAGINAQEKGASATPPPLPVDRITRTQGTSDT